MVELGTRRTNRKGAGRKLSAYRLRAPHFYPKARETGISQRMIAYYEKQTQYPPTHLLPILAEVLGASADELLGIKK